MLKAGIIMRWPQKYMAQTVKTASRIPKDPYKLKMKMVSQYAESMIPFFASQNFEPKVLLEFLKSYMF